MIPFPIKIFVIDCTVSSWYSFSQEASDSTPLPLIVRTPSSSVQVAVPVSGISDRAGSTGSTISAVSVGSSRTGSPVIWI